LGLGSSSNHQVRDFVSGKAFSDDNNLTSSCHGGSPSLSSAYMTNIHLTPALDTAQMA
jgi:hypothetical protein